LIKANGLKGPDAKSWAYRHFMTRAARPPICFFIFKKGGKRQKHINTFKSFILWGIQYQYKNTI